MGLNTLNSKERQAGKDNYADAVRATDSVRVTRRQLLTGAAVIPTAVGMYWGYEQIKGDPVKVAVIGTGNQGRAHISSMNPDYIKMVAFCDIRPLNQKNTRLLLDEKFGRESKNIKLYKDYRELLADPDIEMVIIALPLHLHAKVTIEALKAGKHVLCEKLMAKTVAECKDMIRTADAQKQLLAIGHQRHYSYLYANCQSIIEQNEILGDVKHIRAYWHRNQTKFGHPEGPTGKFDSWHNKIKSIDKEVDFAQHGYKSLDELINWRLYDRTGGGLMVELGSHQLDAASIFLGKIHPKAVLGTGVTSYFTDGREVEDHIFLTFEFPKDVIVTYSSICTNEFDGYGEEVMGTRGTLIVQKEANAYVFKEGVSKDTRITWAEHRLDRPTTDSGSSAQWVSSTETPNTMTSRGYREEQEHMAWIIRNGGIECAQQPRCNGRVALADAVVALSANLAMRTKQRIAFKPAWFDVKSDETPEADFPVV